MAIKVVSAHLPVPVLHRECEHGPVAASLITTPASPSQRRHTHARTHRRRWAARTRWVLGGVLAAAALWLLACWLLPSGSDNSLVGHSHDKEVLVMYIFAATDPEFLGNLRFFIREAVQNDAQSDYVIVVQQSDNLKVCAVCRGGHGCTGRTVLLTSSAQGRAAGAAVGRA